MDPLTTTGLVAALAGFVALIKPLIDVLSTSLTTRPREVTISVKTPDGSIRALNVTSGRISEDQLRKIVSLLEEATNGAAEDASKE